MRKYTSSIRSVRTSSVTEESQLSAVDGYGLCSVNYPNKPNSGCESVLKMCIPVLAAHWKD